METVILLLFALLPVIFKLIGKKFEQAGNPDAAERMRKIAQVLGESDEKEKEPEVDYDDDGQITEVAEPATTSAHAPTTFVVPLPVSRPEPVVTENVVRQTAPKPRPVKKPILEEEVSQRKVEKIDPKKLVIYSEIMKPKYTE